MLDRSTCCGRSEPRPSASKVRKILIGECGHASRSAKYFFPTFCGGSDALPVRQHHGVHPRRRWREGRLKLDPGRRSRSGSPTTTPATSPAPAGSSSSRARSCKAICRNFVEMTPNRRDNYCCGGGGGTVSIDEIRPFRTLIGGKAKAEQIRATGATILVAPCANCKKQLREVCEDHGLDVQVVGPARPDLQGDRASTESPRREEAIGRGSLDRLRPRAAVPAVVLPDGARAAAPALAHAVAGIVQAYLRSRRPRRWRCREIARQTAGAGCSRCGWLRERGRSTASRRSLFHAGLILLVPLFLRGPRRCSGGAALGFGMAGPAAGHVADWLTLLAIGAAARLFAGRARRPAVPRPSAAAGLRLAAPAASCRSLTGLRLRATRSSAPRTYQASMLLHLLTRPTAVMLLTAVHQDRPLRALAAVPAGHRRVLEVRARRGGPGRRDAGHAGRPSWADKSRVGGVQS